jgi:hypothetical protein
VAARAFDTGTGAPLGDVEPLRLASEEDGRVRWLRETNPTGEPQRWRLPGRRLWSNRLSMYFAYLHCFVWVAWPSRRFQLPSTHFAAMASSQKERWFTTRFPWRAEWCWRFVCSWPCDSHLTAQGSDRAVRNRRPEVQSDCGASLWHDPLLHTQLTHAQCGPRLDQLCWVSRNRGSFVAFCQNGTITGRVAVSNAHHSPQ